jgi:hypothetical protein
MASLWYCCKCTFGPHNSSLYDTCIQCGDSRCARCTEEKIHGYSQTTPTIPSICDSCLTGGETAIEQETARQVPDYSTGSRERLKRRTAQEEAADSTVSSSREPGIPKWLPQSFESLELSRRQKSSTSPGTLLNNPTDNIQSGPSRTPQAKSSSVRPKCSSTRSIVYSPSLGSVLLDWVYKQFSRGVYSFNEIQTLENVLVELKNNQTIFIYFETEDDMSFWNTFKGNVETINGGVLDWWPFQPYMTPLAEGQIRLCWECVCILPSTGVNSLLM